MAAAPRCLWLPEPDWADTTSARASTRRSIRCGTTRASPIWSAEWDSRPSHRNPAVRGEVEGDGVEIETPRYDLFTRILADIARQGGAIREIAGNDEIMVSLTVRDGAAARVEHGTVILRMKRDGFLASACSSISNAGAGGLPQGSSSRRTRPANNRARLRLLNTST